MEKPISQGLKITFLIHAIVCLVYGLPMLLTPGWFAQLAGVTSFDPETTSVFGAALVALAVSSWLGYQATTWDKVEIVVLMEIAYTILGSLTTLYHLLFVSATPMGWVSLVVLVAFAVAWIVFYFKHR